MNDSDKSTVGEIYDELDTLWAELKAAADKYNDSYVELYNHFHAAYQALTPSEQKHWHTERKPLLDEILSYPPEPPTTIPIVGDVVDVRLPAWHQCAVEAVHADGTITVRPVCCEFRNCLPTGSGDWWWESNREETSNASPLAEAFAAVARQG